MALVRCDFFSEALELSTSMTVILPQETSAQIGLPGAAVDGDPPVLYLLHGLSDDDTTWLRRTSIERYVAPLGLAVVMPQVHRSFYTDMAHGGRYWAFLSQELPAVVSRFFRVSPRRADTFVAGLSMGGYGAFQWALRQPERFAAAASLSGAVDVVRVQGEGERAELMGNVFGGVPAEGTASDLFHLLHTVDRPGDLPALYLGCGEQDHLVEDNRRFVREAALAGVRLESRFSPGEHEWGFWDATIQDVLAWLPVRTP